MKNDDELWHRLPQLSLRHVVPRKPRKVRKRPSNLSATKRKKRRLATELEAEEKRWRTFNVHQTK